MEKDDGPKINTNRLELFCPHCGKDCTQWWAGNSDISDGKEKDLIAKWIRTPCDRCGRMADE